MKQKKKEGLKTDLLKKVRRDIYITKMHFYDRLFFILMGTSNQVMSPNKEDIENIVRELRLKSAREMFSMKTGKRKLKF